MRPPHSRERLRWPTMGKGRSTNSPDSGLSWPDGDLHVEGDWPSQARLGIVVPTYRRADYLERCLYSLGESDLSDCVLCIVDESEAGPGPVPAGFTALRGVDSPAHDSGNVGADVFALAERALHDGSVAFNDAGWIKSHLLPVDALNESVGFGFRLFVRNEFVADNPQYLVHAIDAPPDTSGARRLVESWTAPVPTLKLFKTRHRGVHDSLRTGWDRLVESCACRYLCNVDSDMIVKPGWVDTLTDLHDRLDRPEARPLICTGFNARDHPLDESGDGFGIKASIGGANLLFDVGTYRDVVRPQLQNVAWDWRLCEAVQRSHGTLATTIPSVSQHIGVTGMWSSPDSHDRADDF